MNFTATMQNLAIGIIGGSIFIIVGIYCYIKAGKINKPFEEELVVYKKGEIK